MIIDVFKYVFVGSKDDLDRFFARAQKSGIAEFISQEMRKGIDLPKNLEHIHTAIKALRKQPKLPEVYVSEDKDVSEIVDKINGLKQSIENNQDERRYIETEISRISPFGDFSLNDIAYIEQKSGKRMQFFCMKESMKQKVRLPEELLFIGTEYDMNYFMSLSPRNISEPGLIEMHIESSLSDLKLRLHTVKENIHKNEVELKEMAGVISYLHRKLFEGLDHYELNRTKKDVALHLDDSLFAIQAWIPKNHTDEIKPLLENLAVHVERVAAEKKDRVPTCMQNKGLNRIGEDLVHIYDTPATNDKDPSGWVLWAFALFFALIISDAGYGLIFLLAALFFRYKFYKKAQESLKRLLNLFTIISVGCIIWGVLAGAYFGIKLPPDSPINKISFIDYLSMKKADYHFKTKDETYKEWVKQIPRLAKAKTAKEFVLDGVEKKEGITTYVIMEEFHNNIFLELSLMLGIIHLSLSLIRHLRRSWSGIGWIAFLVGGYFYFPSMLNAITMTQYMGLMSPQTSTEVGLQLVIGGFAVAVALGLLQHKLLGLEEIVKVIQIFADTLSYLRLYALGLAAMILAATFNEIGQGIGFVGGLLVILIGHTVNIALGTMGGVIHGLRLNYIEWYHYSFGGNGKIFKPLKLRIKKGV